MLGHCRTLRIAPLPFSLSLSLLPLFSARPDRLVPAVHLKEFGWPSLSREYPASPAIASHCTCLWANESQERKPIPVCPPRLYHPPPPTPARLPFARQPHLPPSETSREPTVNGGISGKHLEAMPHPILPTCIFRSFPPYPLPASAHPQYSVANIYIADHRQQVRVLTREKQTLSPVLQNMSRRDLVIYFLAFLGVVLAPLHGLRTI